MKKVIAVVVLMLVLVACGGGAENSVDNADTPANSGGEAQPTPTTEVEAPADDAGDDDAAADNADDAAADEDAAADDDAADDAGDEILYSGVDPETGMLINPMPAPVGEEFIVRGEIISSNLTPQESPEFVVRTPDNQTFRMGAQPVNEIFFQDGVTQLQPFEYGRGIQVEAVVLMPAGSGPSDVLETETFTIISDDR